MSNILIADKGQDVPTWKKALNYLLVCVVVVAIFGVSLSAAGITLSFSFVEQYKVRIWDGFWMTVGISSASLIVSTALGILVALGQGARFLPIRYLCDMYVKIIRGTPLIAQIYFFYYIIGTAWGVDNKVLAGIIILSLFAGAYIAEIIRAGYQSLPKGPLEAASALGMTQLQVGLNVALPQMVTRTLPALTGQFASIIKD